MRAVILVGGQATRLRPLTDNKPKALLQLQGKTVLEHVLDLFKKYGITRITLAVGFCKEQIIEYFGDGSAFGFSIDYIEEHEPLGTAGPLRLLHDVPTDTFVVCNGDELKEIDIPVMLEQHHATGAKATLALRSVDDPTSYGIARVDGKKILEFVEKPSREEAPSDLMSAGFYLLEPEVLGSIPEGKAMLEYDVFPKLAAKNELYGYVFTGQWFDTGTIERLKQAEEEWQQIT